MKNTKAEPSIVPSSGINSPMINVVVIISFNLAAKVNKKSQSNAISPWDLIFIRFQSDDVLCRIELLFRLLTTRTTPVVGQVFKGNAVVLCGVIDIAAD